MAADERRRKPRYPFSASAEIFDQDDDSSTSSKVRDLSEGGCYVETSDPLPPGKNVKVEIHTDGQFLETLATVAFREDNEGMGLAFAPMQPHFNSVLINWLAWAQDKYTH
jgi:PilZ domain